MGWMTKLNIPSRETFYEGDENADGDAEIPTPEGRFFLFPNKKLIEDQPKGDASVGCRMEASN